MYANRWILPCHYFGELTGFEAKTYGNGKPKSLFPEWFRPDSTVYTTTWDVDQDFCVITESIFDAETLGSNAIGIFGSVLRHGQLQKLLEMRNTCRLRRLVWFLDPDAVKKQTRAIVTKTLPHFTNYIVRSEYDPNDTGSTKCWKLVKNSIPVASARDILNATTR
jgi:hypothetical protein